MSQTESNPFNGGMWEGHSIGAVTVGYRLDMVEGFTYAQCEAALEVPDLQKTVRRAIERRMKELADPGQSGRGRD